MESLVVMAVVMAIMLGISLYMTKLKREKWQAWAKSVHWSYQGELKNNLARSLRGGPFGTGKSRSLSHVVQGRCNGLPATSLHYSYSTGSGDDRTTYHYHVLRLTIGGAKFPLTELSHENWATRLFEDIQFEDAEFNRQWRVTGSSRHFAHRLIHPRAMEWLKSYPFPPFTTLWLEENAVWIAKRGYLQPHELAPYFETLCAFAHQMPRFLLDEVGSPKELGMTRTGYGSPTG